MGRIENLKPFKSGAEWNGNANGRPKSRVAEARVKVMGKAKAKEYHGISATEYMEWCESLISAEVPALKAWAQDDGTPVFARAYARAILFDMKNGKTTTLDKIAEKLYGKAVQRVEHTGADGSNLIPARTLTKEEAKELMQDLEKEF